MLSDAVVWLETKDAFVFVLVNNDVMIPLPMRAHLFSTGLHGTRNGKICHLSIVLNNHRFEAAFWTRKGGTVLFILLNVDDGGTDLSGRDDLLMWDPVDAAVLFILLNAEDGHPVGHQYGFGLGDAYLVKIGAQIILAACFRTVLCIKQRKKTLIKTWQGGSR